MKKSVSVLSLILGLFVMLVATSNAKVGDAKVESSQVFPRKLPFPYVKTLAGDGQAGNVDGSPSRINRPHGLSYANDGSLYFADRGNHQIRVVKPNGMVVTVAGTSKAGFADGSANTAMFNEPIAVVASSRGIIYVADRNNHRIRKITPDGIVSTLAGGDLPGFVDGDLKSARFNQPYGVALDLEQTTLYVADYLNHAIRKIDLVTNQVQTLAGNGTAGFVNGSGKEARFHQPYNVRIDGKGALWVPDQLNHAIRKITPAGDVSTVAGTGKSGYVDGSSSTALFNNPTGVVVLPNGAAIVADRNNNCLRLVTPDGAVVTLAGAEAGFADGLIATARFNQPLDVDFDDSMSQIMVSEDKGHRLRVLPKDTDK